MFERILERISISKYNKNFILKGGILLSAIFGINERSTKDIDTTIVGIDVSKEKMLKTLNEILCVNLNDGVTFDVVNINDIREESEYGGNKYSIVGKIESLKVQLEIDISTGDMVTPRKMKYKYNLIFEDRSIVINSYNLETILAEKLETILRRGKFNSRMKDYYDIYYILHNLYYDIDILILKNAIKNTFNKRNSIKYLNDYKEIIVSIKNGSIINNLWNVYSSKYRYASNIKFSNILETIENILDDINLKMV